MLKRNFIFFTRIFVKDKFFFVLNILGLALGIAVAILLLLILQHDLLYDQHHERHERIYRLGAFEKIGDSEFYGAITARELGPVLKSEFPQIEDFVRVEVWGRTLVKHQYLGSEENAFYEENIARTDSNYFKVFSHEFISGNPRHCLNNAQSVVVTQSVAYKYFGDSDPITKILIIENQSWEVTAVIKDLPDNSHLKFGILLSHIETRHYENSAEAFWNPDVYTYLLLHPDAIPNEVISKFPIIYDKYLKSIGDKISGQFSIIMEPLADIHFYSKLESDLPRGSIGYLYAFITVGCFIVILASINYMNLATAKSISRSKEVAVKKVMGSNKRALVVSFLAESIFLSFISLILSIGILFVLLKSTSFSNTIQKNLLLNFIENPVLVFGVIFTPILIGLISGVYPAVYLTNMEEITALKGNFKDQKGGLLLRKILITGQFSISILVASCVLLMKTQVNFLRSKDIGFNKENVVLLPIRDEQVQKQLKSIKSELLQQSEVISVSTSNAVLGTNGSLENWIMWAEGDEGMRLQNFSVLFVGEDYLKTMGISLVSGSDFTNGESVDIENEFIANESAAKVMGWTNDPLRKKVKFYHGTKDSEIIGLVKDFNFSSLHNPIEPLLIRRAEEGGYLHVRVKGNTHATVKLLKSVWEKVDTTHPFEYFFLDHRLNEQYKNDEIQNRLLSWFAYTCIFVALLGLIGLSAFSAQQRTKEIGIRKVLGANIFSIVFLLYKEILFLVLVASLLTTPASIYVFSTWLMNFAYQVDTNYYLIAFVVILAIVLSFITVVFYSWRAARINPVRSLKE